jgi:FkbM family methyltransferase
LGLDLQPQFVREQRTVFQQWRGRGVTVCFVVYDLLCIERPDCFFPGADQGFAGWLEVVADADRALCISAATADSLRSWIALHRPERLDRLAIGHFHLGADFIETEAAPSLPVSWSGRPAGPTLLMVGTIEPRKAYQAALTAAETLWREGEIFTLAIVGRVGWMVEPLVELLRGHAERERRLFWFEGVDDATLAALYQQADGMLLASEGEGFGLPLVEAAHYGLPILARDLPVFREIGGDRVTYFSDDLVGRMRDWLAALAAGTAKSSTGIAQLSWEDSTRLLLARLLPAAPVDQAPSNSAETEPAGSALSGSQSPLQLYCGYEADDIALLQRYATQSARVFSDHFIDGFGNKTLFTNVRFCAQFRPSRLQLPVPDDGYHAETIEYVALVDSVDRAAPSHYCVVEIGAAWGPWISLGGTLARRTGRAAITLVGVEADPDRFQLVAEQLIANQLRPQDPLPGQAASGDWTLAGRVRCRLIQGAAGAKPGILWFPKLNIADLGAAASNEKLDLDYRGAEVESYEVKAYMLDDILDGVDHVDLLHVDIQGSEFELLRHNLDLLAAKVDAMLIGTHSRKIEGDLVELLLGAGWRLHREKPCRVDWTLDTPDLTGRTVTDGCQYWRRGTD